MHFPVMHGFAVLQSGSCWQDLVCTEMVCCPDMDAGVYGRIVAVIRTTASIARTIISSFTGSTLFLLES